MMSSTIGHDAGTPRGAPTGDSLGGVYKETAASFDLVEETPGYHRWWIGGRSLYFILIATTFSRLSKKGALRFTWECFLR